MIASEVGRTLPVRKRVGNSGAVRHRLRHVVVVLCLDLPPGGADIARPHHRIVLRHQTCRAFRIRLNETAGCGEPCVLFELDRTRREEIQTHQAQGKTPAHLCSRACLQVDFIGRDDLSDEHLVVLLQDNLDGELLGIHLCLGGNIFQLALHVAFRHRDDARRVPLRHLKFTRSGERRRIRHGLHFALCRVGERVVDRNSDGSDDHRNRETKHNSDIRTFVASKVAPGRKRHGWNPSHQHRGASI